MRFARAAPQRGPARLLDHLQLGAPRPATLFGLWRACRWRGFEILLGEHHALAGLARIDPEHRAHRKAHVVDHPGKARVELDLFVPQAQSLGSAFAEVED